MKINRLSSELSNLIAAGEVVEKPLSIIKELIENSIDAEASKIEIILLNSGLDKIEIIDNGVGMSKLDCLASVERHATSKISSKNDLFDIHTLGFRGEALASIASVSKFSVFTNDGEESTKLYIEGGKIIDCVDFPTNIGTKTIVSNMFYNTPARLKFLKSEQYELSLIVDYVQKIALSYPNIKFSLSNNNKVIINTTANENFIKTISEVYNFEISQSISSLKFNNYDFYVELYYSSPDVTKSSKNFINISINNRVVKNYKITQALIDSYKDKLFNKRYPIIVINIKVDPILTDVNIHPSKLEVKLSKEKELIELITTNLTNSLFTSSSNYEIKSKIEEKDVVDYNKLINTNNINKPLNDSISLNVESKPTQQSFDFEFKEIDDVTLVNKFTEKEFVEKKEKVLFPKLNYIGQIFDTYLFFQSFDSFYIMDQHAAAERINYEIILDKLEKKTKDYYELLVPLELDYSKSDNIKILSNINKFIDYGIIIEEISIDKLILRSVPIWFKKGYELEYLDELVQEFISDKKSLIISDLAASIACKKSIKANQYLTTEGVNTLIKDLENCVNPFNCPHGRPVMLKYTINELEKMFKRS